MKTSVPSHKKKPAVARKKAPAKTAARKPSASPVKRAAPPPGYMRAASGVVLVPTPRATRSGEPGVVPASKLQKGISKAREQISGVLQELLEATRDGYEVTEIELSASFSADGKFLGFGVGGEMSITFKVRPTDEV